MLLLKPEIRATFETFFGEGHDIPSAIQSFTKAPLPLKNEAWLALRDFFFNYPKVKESAIYAVPHIVSCISDIPPSERGIILSDIADIARIFHLGETHIPASSLAEFNEAISELAPLAMETLQTIEDPGSFQAMLSSIAVFLGQYSVAQSIFDALLTAPPKG